jgi:hypothetical protein
LGPLPSPHLIKKNGGGFLTSSFTAACWRTKGCVSSWVALGRSAGRLRRQTPILARRFHPQFRDKNRRDIGKSQSVWTDSKMETARSQLVELRRVTRRVDVGRGVARHVHDEFELHELHLWEEARSKFRDKNRRGIGKSQSQSTRRQDGPAPLCDTRNAVGA